MFAAILRDVVTVRRSVGAGAPNSTEEEAAGPNARPWSRTRSGRARGRPPGPTCLVSASRLAGSPECPLGTRTRVRPQPPRSLALSLPVRQAQNAAPPASGVPTESCVHTATSEDQAERPHSTQPFGVWACTCWGAVCPSALVREGEPRPHPPLRQPPLCMSRGGVSPGTESGVSGYTEMCGSRYNHPLDTMSPGSQACRPEA